MGISLNSKKLFVFWALFSGIFFYAPEAKALVISAPSNNIGLVARWTFDGADVTDKVYDRIGGNNGNIRGGIATSSVAGKLGQGFNFFSTSSQQNVRTSTNASLDLNTNNTLSVSVWVKPSSTAGNQWYLGYTNNCTNTTPGQWQYIMQISGSNRFSFDVGDGNVGRDSASSTSAIIPNQWYLLTGVVSANTVYLYVNGVLVSQTGRLITPETVSGGNSFAGFTFNGTCATTGRNSFGTLDDARVYNRALSATEVKNLYGQGTNKVNSGSQSSVNGSTLNQGLISYWSLNGADVTDKVYDRSGAGNNGYFYNGATSTAKVQGKLGQGISLDGVDDYVRSSTLVNTAVVTVSAWVKISSRPSPSDGFIAGFVNGIGNGNHDKNLLIKTDGKLYFYVYDGAQKTTSAPASAIPLNTWVHVVGTADGTTARTYLNGVEVGSVAAGNTFTSYTVPNIFIGGATGNAFVGGTYMAQSIDDVRVYNRALSAAEIKQLYQEGGGKLNASGQTLQNGTSLTSGLAGYWSFNGADITDKVYDRVGGNNGYVTGVSTSSAKVAGKLGQALRFNGSNSAVSVGAASPLNISGTQITISAWIYPVGFGGGSLGRIIDKNDGTNGYLFIVSNFPGANTIKFGINASAVNGTDVCEAADNSISLNRWQHVTIVYNNGCTFYVNGQAKSNNYQISGSINATPTVPFTIGSRSSDTARVFNGSIDEVRVYNRALSGAEVKSLYNLGK